MATRSDGDDSTLSDRHPSNIRHPLKIFRSLRISIRAAESPIESNTRSGISSVTVTSYQSKLDLEGS